MGGTHFVNVSVEADTVCGLALAAIADRNDVTYTLAYGDQPGKIVELCGWAMATGFEIVAAGRAARQPTRHGTPDDALDRHPFVTAFGEDLEPNPVMYNTFMDGTKEAVESVAAANALGLGIDERGLHRPEIERGEIPETFRPASEGGVLESTGVVDSVTPTDDSFSVFVVTRTESRQLIDYYDHRPSITTSEDGRYQLFHTPSHFAPETTRSIASAALLNEATGAPSGHHAEVVAGAKRDLEVGEAIDGGGGSTVYGVAAGADDAAAADLVPFELLDGAAVLEPVGQDELVRADHVEIDRDQPMYHLRGLQGF
jgi:predicted homoserine dehydrogenase-like protein